MAAMNALMLEERTLFITDTFVNRSPAPRNWPRSQSWPRPGAAFSCRRRRWRSCRIRCSARRSAVGQRMRAARDLFVAALRRTSNATARCRATPPVEASARASCRTHASAARPTCWCCPNLDAANILFNVLKVTGGQGVTVGPILLGRPRRRTSWPSGTVRRIVNMTALAVADAAARRSSQPEALTAGHGA